MPAGKTYTPLATTTLSSAAASVTFSSISGSYTDLVLVMNVKVSSGSQGNYMRVNSDTASNYSRTFVAGNGSTAFSARNTSFTYFDPLYFTTEWANCIINLQNYANTTTNKTFLARGNGLEVAAIVGLWRSTAAINAISLQPSAGSYESGSTFTLYGILAA